MSREISKTKRIGIMAMFISVGLVLQYAESRLIVTNVPGGKLGLANVVSIINIFMFGGGNALVIASLRAVLGCLFSGGLTALPYSLAGAFFSTLAMCGIKKLFYPKVSMIGISVTGAAVHNLAQISVASVVFSSGYVFSYLPVLLIVAAVSGIATGYAAELIYGKLQLH